ncbi:2'-5'-oligoadenylate synthase 1A-like [Crassostrea virginica]
MKLYLYKYGGCDITGTTPHAVQVSVHCHGHSHNADILPSVDILKTQTLHEIYKEMDSEPHSRRKFYSAALAPLQIEFVSHVPPKVKNLIRLMKFWKNSFKGKKSKKQLPPSYLLELIVIGEWNRAKSPENFDLQKGFYHVLTAIRNYKEMGLVSTQNYTSHHCHDAYYVMDPANPFNNVMSDCNCWEHVAEKARHFLKTAQLYKDSPNLDGWL